MNPLWWPSLPFAPVFTFTIGHHLHYLFAFNLQTHFSFVFVSYFFSCSFLWPVSAESLAHSVAVVTQLMVGPVGPR